MLRCPHCSRELSRALTPFGVVHHCRDCGGRLVGLATLRRDGVATPFRADLWQHGAYGPAGDRACPHCHHPMRRAIMPPRYGGLELDVCRHCMVVWFDPDEYAAFRARPAAAEEAAAAAESPPFAGQEAREAMAMLQLQAVQERQEADSGAVGPDSPWKFLPAVFGLPVEMASSRLSAVPLVTWMTAAVLGVVLLLTRDRLGAAVAGFGFVPADWSRLAGNAYFLLIFGDNVEDRLGRARFLLLLLLSHLAGAALHAVLDPRGDLPLVGASAGIFGVVAFYAAAFPRARLGLLVFYFFWLRLPAWTLLLFYAMAQVLGALVQVSGYGSVSSLGHLGGLAVGLLFALLWRQANGPGAARGGLRDGYRRGERDA
jgi:Zn-finger nucleic acid-binding protein